MNPFKSFLFLFFTIVLFLSVQYIREFYCRNSDTVSSLEIPDTLIAPSDALASNSVQYEMALVSDKKGDSGDAAKKLFYPQPFLFSPDDTVRLGYMSKKLNDTASQKLPVRIVYFGDSQIEHDRVTFNLRKKLQHKFGGMGVGLVPPEQIYNSKQGFVLEPSGCWMAQTYRDENFLNKNLLFRHCLLTGEGVSAAVRIKQLNHLKADSGFDKIKVFYQLFGDCQLELVASKGLIRSEPLPSADTLKVLDLNFNQTPEEIKLNFKCNGELNLFGISMESGSGVLVDNVSLRGLSYPPFEWSDPGFVKAMINRLNVGLFVLHFGVNLVPYESEDYRYFRQHFERQVRFLKDNYPEVPILIIGVSDMARKTGGDFESYPNIQQIKAIQEEIAKQNQAVFWDMEAFMGGKGGMRNWVNATPPLGRTDYAHFSKEGAGLVGKELAKMIIALCENDSIAIK